jgi:hypothetical protein
MEHVRCHYLLVAASACMDMSCHYLLVAIDSSTSLAPRGSEVVILDSMYIKALLSMLKYLSWTSVSVEGFQHVAIHLMDLLYAPLKLGSFMDKHLI